MEKNLLVVDIGTQSLRTSIIDPSGNTLVFKQVQYEEPFFSPREGYAEQNIDYYMEELCLTTKSIKEENPTVFSTISGMVVVDFRDSSVILDENNKPIRNAILWLDQRVTLLHNRNFKWYEKALFSVIGMLDTVKFNAERTPTWWLMENEPDNWARMKHYCTFGAYFNYCITGNLTVSSADCVGHYPIDFAHSKWFFKGHPKYDVFGIPYSALIPLVRVGDVIGKVSSEFSALSGIPEGLPVYASASDKACETFGNGCVDKSVASISLGTACTIDVVDQKYSEPEAFLPSYQAPYKGAYNLEVQIYHGLWMIRWFIREFASAERKEAKLAKMTIEQYLDSKILDIKPGSDGLVLQPYWGPGLSRPNSKGSIVGFSAIHTKYHIYRAILEGIAFALREALDAIMKKTHKKPDYIVVSGGGSGSEVILHIIADVFGIEVRKSASSQCSSLGAAMSGYLANGTYKTPEEAVKNMVKEPTRILPDPNNSAIYDKLYKKVYLKLYPALKKPEENIKYFYLENNGVK
ncbi:MAG: FGGY-family carbohydrate kinase [Bacilli bacterium]